MHTLSIRRLCTDFLETLPYDDLADGKDYASLKGWEQINVENKTVEMVVKDLLLADNQKKKPYDVGSSVIEKSPYI